jgi:hypothetical protein
MSLVFGDSTNKGEDCYRSLYMLRNESGMASRNQACARATHAALSRVCPIARLYYFRRVPGVSASPPARDFWKSGRSTAPPIRALLPILLAIRVLEPYIPIFPLFVFLVAIPSFRLRASAPTLLQQCLTPRSELRLLTTLSSLSTWSEHVHWCAQSLFRGYSSTSATGLSMTTTRSLGRFWSYVKSRLNLCTRDTNVFLSFLQYHSLP